MPLPPVAGASRPGASHVGHAVLGARESNRALVLNASYEALCVVPSRRALMLVLDQRAEVLHATERVFRSQRSMFPEPSVVRLSHYVKVPYETRVALNRRAVFVRDDHRCQYCGATAENIDHVIPRSRGGTHTWDNVVAACRPCNTRKEDRLLHEVGLTLRQKPSQPRNRIWMFATKLRPDWAP